MQRHNVWRVAVEAKQKIISAQNGSLQIGRTDVQQLRVERRRKQRWHKRVAKVLPDDAMLRRATRGELSVTGGE